VGRFIWFGIEAHESVVTALACFALYPQDYRAAIATAFWQGGDTIGAMTGALVGAHIGSECAKTMQESLDRLEQGEKFVAYIQALAERLAAAPR
jgi:poly(ADP-ribose) glycohydrolase ARH3